MAPDKMSTQTFGEAVKKFADAGISPKFLVPVIPPGAAISHTANIEDGTRGKVPGRYVGAGAWAGLGYDILSRGATRDEEARFVKWPTGNVGVMGLAYPGIDSDAESPEMADIVHLSIREAFGGMRPAVRLRGANHRRVYAFKARDWKSDPVRTRRVRATLKGVESGLDIQGAGSQYLIAGTHANGHDIYSWQRNDELHSRNVVNDLKESSIDNLDIDRFLDVFERNLKKAGGEIITRNASVKGAEYDPSNSEPAFPVRNIFSGLDRIPNSNETFPHREDFIGVIAGIRAAAGRDGTSQDFEDRVREWACADASWCSDEYFSKIWDSLGRVRVSRNSLDGIFRRNGVFVNTAEHIDDRAAEVSAEIKEHKGEAKKARVGVLDRVAARYVFGDVNTRDDKTSPDMRLRWDPGVAWNALSWWDRETVQPDTDLVDELNAEFGGKKPGFWVFLRAMKVKHPECFFIDETRNPNFDYGEIITETNPDTERKSNLLNMRTQSAVIRAASKPDKHPERSRKDVERFLEFGSRLFGKMWDYELRTLAFMAQTKKRPGHMLFLVGESGMGKSTYTQFLLKIFNGTDTGGIVDGSKLTTEGAARFAFAKVEGSRLISIRELPKGGRRNAAILQQVTSTIKQMVDAGPEGDFFTLEDKGDKSKIVRNFARIVASSNHADAVEIEEGDRRIFMVNSCINTMNKPDEDYYANLMEIMGDVDRLAAIYRSLLGTEIGAYNANTPPPVSIAKAERQVANTQSPIERHMRAAIALLDASDRKAFDGEELAELMTKMSAAEAEFLQNGDEPVDYITMYRADDIKDRGAFGRGIQRIQKFCTALEHTRSSKKRDAAAYVINGTEPGLDLRLNAMTREDRLDYLDAQYDLGVVKVHPWPQFRGKGV